jgi:hypothetical protein
VRVYLPATATLVQTLVDSGRLAGPLTAFAVTAGLREWYADDDIETLEYAALLEAARASLRLLDTDEAAVRRRVVIALDSPDASVSVRDDLDRGVVRIEDDVDLAQVASLHIDDAVAEPTVAAAAAAMIAADLGDPSSIDAVDDAEGFELSWYAAQEIDAVLATLA